MMYRCTHSRAAPSAWKGLTVMSSRTDLIPAIEFRNVNFAYGDKPVLTDISFQLQEAEMILIIGESGSGKSVLLRLAMGLLRPDSGQIFIRANEIETLSEIELLAIRGGQMGMVFQEESLFTGLTVFENAAYRLEEHGWKEEDIEKAVDEVLNYVGLGGEEEKYPEHLSGGMKRRLEIARALIGWPSIMLFDEPTMGLDPIVAGQVLDLIIRARDINKISSLFVTKRPFDISYLSTFRASVAEDETIQVREAPSDKVPQMRVIVLEEGKIRFVGSTSEFERSTLPSVRRMLTLEQHEHSRDPYFKDPWDKSRRPLQKIL
jgi:phospholipid/cholesterol/gamma-HCH transport system ATP-binding protein